MTDEIKFTKAMTNEVQKLGKLCDAIGEAGEQGKLAQQTYLLECANVGVKFSESQADAILTTMAGDNPGRKAKLSEGRKFAHPNVAPHASTLFEKARAEGMDALSASVVARASKMATILKEGKASTVDSAADQALNTAKAKKAEKSTPEGAAKACKASIKKHMSPAGFTPEDIAPVLAALDAMVAAGPTPPAEEPEPEPVPTTADALEATASLDDKALGDLLAGLATEPAAKAKLIAALLS